MDSMTGIYKKIVIKIGTNVITCDDGSLNQHVLTSVVDQVGRLKKQGKDVIIVSSGAMASGRALVRSLNTKVRDIAKRQLLSAVGQAHLIQTYAKHFAKHKLICAQILATKQDFKDRRHYLNMKNCFDALLDDNIIPIVNENDAVAISELMFTDNDELAALVASMMDVDALIILTNVDGVMTKDPKISGAKIISTIEPGDPTPSVITATKSSMGRGGMQTKFSIAKRLSQMGIATHVVNGSKNDVINDIVSGRRIGTTFVAKKRVSSVKKWIGASGGLEKGIVYVNNCVIELFRKDDRARSLLPIGIVKIEGEFQKGDIIKIMGETGDDLGLGVAEYSSETAKKNMGQKNKKAVVHYDYLYLRF